ncbi:MAG TPA: hypothetical protein VFB79_11815, partial [Candidatus Angelobacter sp.]|nr:hypothetical protein [Candidatus Angelobacter sp.]
MSINRVWQSDVAYTGGAINYYHGGYYMVTRDGANHLFAGNPATTDSLGEPWSFDAGDTSGFHLDLAGPLDEGGAPSTGIVTDRNGNRYQFGPFTGRCRSNANAGAEGAMPYSHGGGWNLNNYGQDTVTTCNQRAVAQSVTDTNGNVINFGVSDMLGRSNSFSGTSTTDYSGCVGLAAGAITYSFPAISGSTAQLKLCSSSPSLATAFNMPNVTEYPNWPGATNYDSPWPGRSWITTAILPDGSKYSFTYDSYGEITSIGLPTGGSISYTWTTIALNLCGDPTPASRAVASRTVNDGQGHIQTWNYAYSLLSTTMTQTVVTDPDHNDTVHIVNGQDNLGCMLYETSTRFYNGSSAGGLLLKQVDTHYIGGLLPDDTGVSNTMHGNFVPDSIKTTVYPSNKVMLITKSYDQVQPGTGVIFGNVVSEKVYDWGQAGSGQPGGLLRETDTTYQWQGNSAYLTTRLLDLPASIVVKDGSGNRVAETDYTYDEASYLASARITTQHVAPPYGVRGNQTTVSHWLNTTNGSVVSHTNWYDTGEVYQKVDPLGHTTTYSYDPAYVGAYVTQTCSPATNGGATTHCVSGTYDFNTGVLTSLTNENATTQASGNTQGDSAHTSNYSYDSMFRITSAQAPPDPANSSLRAQNTFNFSAANVFPITVQRVKSVTTALSDSATSSLDGLGRVFKTQHAVPGNTATVDTTFDQGGHVATVSNPYFSTSDATYGITTNIYDGLDRVTQTTKQDGSVSSVKYSVATTVPANGDCNITTDEAGHDRGTCTDALGRLVEVDEPNPGATVSVNNYATMQTDGNFVLYSPSNS